MSGPSTTKGTAEAVRDAVLTKPLKSGSKVKACVQQLFQKTRVRTRSQLVRIALEGSLGNPRKL